MLLRDCCNMFIPDHTNDLFWDVWIHLVCFRHPRLLGWHKEVLDHLHINEANSMGRTY